MNSDPTRKTNRVRNQEFRTIHIRVHIIAPEKKTEFGSEHLEEEEKTFVFSFIYEGLGNEN